MIAALGVDHRTLSGPPAVVTIAASHPFSNVVSRSPHIVPTSIDLTSHIVCDAYVRDLNMDDGRFTEKSPKQFPTWSLGQLSLNGCAMQLSFTIGFVGCFAPWSSTFLHQRSITSHVLGLLTRSPSTVSCENCDATLSLGTWSDGSNHSARDRTHHK
jgi:hypothetical protein